jgi:hypothetical protein
VDKTANKIFLNNNGFIETEFHGFQTQESLLAVRAEYQRLCTQLTAEKKNIYLLINLDGVSKTDAGARSTAVKILHDLPFVKVSVYGGDLFMRVVAKLIITATENFVSIRYFSSREEAEKWLLA